MTVNTSSLHLASILVAAWGLACSIEARNAPSEVADDIAPENVNRYDIDITPKLLAKRESPAEPYRKAYEFDAEQDWFSAHVPVWRAALEPFNGRPGLSYLEIGCYEGRSAIWMLENILSHESSEMTCVDPYPDHVGEDVKQRFLANVRLSGAAERVHLIQGYSQTALRPLPLDHFDIIYIDGDHRAAPVLEDAVLSWRLLKQRGIMIFDDYDWETARPAPDRPRMGVEFFVEAFAPQVEVIHREYQLILRKLSN